MGFGIFQHNKTRKAAAGFAPLASSLQGAGTNSFSYYLRLHREALGVDWQGQALHLEISRERLTDLALCRYLAPQRE